MSVFAFKILEESPLYTMIPYKLHIAMEDVADKDEAIRFKP
jgi:hypothetical protein